MRAALAALCTAAGAMAAVIVSCGPIDLMGGPRQSEGERRASALRHVDNAFLMRRCAVPTDTAVRSLVEAWYLEPARVEEALRTMRRRGDAVEVGELTVYTGESCGYCRDLIRRGRGDTCPALDLQLLDAADAARRRA